MGNKALKGLTIKIGGDTTELGKALDSVDKKSRSLSSELGHINRALKLDPTNTELIAQKQQVLAEAITNTEEKLDVLKEAEKQVQAQFERGEVSQDQVRALRREIIETAAKLDKYKNAAKEAAGAGKTLADSAGDAADQLRDQADSAKDADKANEALDDSSGDLASGGLAALTAAAIAAGAAFVATVEGSREYRNEMAKLNTAFQSSRHGGETAKRTYEELQSVLGKTDQAVEAAQQIALLADSEKDAAKWADLAAGLVGRLGNALQPETFYESANETLKLNEATGAYTQLLEQCGESVEKFNEGLTACSTEQEKQEYMLGVTERLLASASREYKNTNAEVIRANQATEKWNQATAKSGATLEPVLTDIKEMGAALWESADKPLEKIASFIRKDLLPTITAAGKWVKSNAPVIKGAVVGVTAAMVAFKVATLANTVAQKGLKKAIMDTAIAQKALALVQAATPLGLVLTGVAAVTVALVAYVAAAKDAKGAAAALSEEEKELHSNIAETTKRLKERDTASRESAESTLAESEYTKRLTDELCSLADANGRVKDSDKTRADFILGKLNEALGTEYYLTDGIIGQYDELRENIYEVINAKTALALAEDYQDEYLDALKEEQRVYAELSESEDNYVEGAGRLQKARQQLSEARMRYNQKESDGYYQLNFEQQTLDTLRIDELEDLVKREQDLYDKRKAAYDSAKENHRLNTEAIKRFELAQTYASEGNLTAVQEILYGKSEAYKKFSSDADEETAKVLSDLEKKAYDAGVKARLFRNEWEKGTEGYTKEMVEEAEQAHKEALAAFETAYADAKEVGEDMGEGMAVGATRMTSVVANSARQLVNNFLEAARKAADSHSPSRKAIKIFEDIGEGGVIGAKRKTKDIARAGAHQAAALLNAYQDQEHKVQHSMVNIADQQATRQYLGQASAASANRGVLGQILQAIKDGQVLILDGDSIVGGTAGKMDRSLGQLRMLSARGAK